MGKIEGIIKSEIQRLAKRDIRSVFLPLKREVRAMRLRLSSLSKSFKALDRVAKEQILPLASEKLKLEVPPEEIKIARLNPARIRSLRKKLGISQRELAILTGVSMGAVVMWEKGKFKPKGDKKGALIALRKLGKRKVKQMLAEKGKKEEAPKKVARRKAKGKNRRKVLKNKAIRRARKAKK